MPRVVEVASELAGRRVARPCGCRAGRRHGRRCRSVMRMPMRRCIGRRELTAVAAFPASRRAPITRRGETVAVAIVRILQLGHRDANVDDVLGSKAGIDWISLTKLRISRPAPTSSTTASAISRHDERTARTLRALGARWFRARSRAASVPTLHARVQRRHQAEQQAGEHRRSRREERARDRRR